MFMQSHRPPEQTTATLAEAATPAILPLAQELRLADSFGRLGLRRRSNGARLGPSSHHSSIKRCRPLRREHWIGGLATGVPCGKVASVAGVYEDPQGPKTGARA